MGFFCNKINSMKTFKTDRSPGQDMGEDSGLPLAALGGRIAGWVTEPNFTGRSCVWSAVPCTRAHVCVSRMIVINKGFFLLALTQPESLPVPSDAFHHHGPLLEHEVKRER